jgi:murein DD-endopeptidase MepM/ murein hydrolase activator NlpD
MRLLVMAAATSAVIVAGLGSLGAVALAAPAPVAGAFVRPVTGAVISQGFGCSPYVFEPVMASCASGHWHSGIDLAATFGTPVRATAPGMAQVVESAHGYGLHVIVDHGGGLTSLYGHLQAVTVAGGEAVAAGQLIGEVGSTGNSTGPHLHFEIRRDGTAEDPALLMTLP